MMCLLRMRCSKVRLFSPSLNLVSPSSSSPIPPSCPSRPGFVTAKVGRPDIYRAGASILRLLHSSLLPWGFRPPPSEFESWPMAQQEGIWFVGFVAKAASAPLREGASEDDEEEEEDDGSEEGESEEEDSADERAVQAVRGAFAALAVEEGEDDSEEEEGSGSGASADESGSGEEEEDEDEEE